MIHRRGYTAKAVVPCSGSTGGRSSPRRHPEAPTSADVDQRGARACWLRLERTIGNRTCAENDRFRTGRPPTGRGHERPPEGRHGRSAMRRPRRGSAPAGHRPSRLRREKRATAGAGRAEKGTIAGAPDNHAGRRGAFTRVTGSAARRRPCWSRTRTSGIDPGRCTPRNVTMYKLPREVQDHPSGGPNMKAHGPSRAGGWAFGSSNQVSSPRSSCLSENLL